MPAPDSIEAIIDARAADLSEFHGLDVSAKADDALPQRQILTVLQTTYFSAGYVAATGAAPDTQTYVLVSGQPSPSSDVTRGYLRFVPRSMVKAPRYDARTKTINVWLDIDALALTLAQLRHAKRYLWIGWFAGGHVYCDLHTSD